MLQQMPGKWHWLGGSCQSWASLPAVGAGEQQKVSFLASSREAFPGRRMVGEGMEGANGQGEGGTGVGSGGDGGSCWILHLSLIT